MIDKLLILVPARGGSKGLPGKHLRKLGGMSVLQWTIEAIRQSPLKKRTPLLSTDDPEIAAHGTELGYDAPFIRPMELAHDTASLVDVALHALTWQHCDTPKNQAEYLLLLQPTSPLRAPKYLEQALQLLTDDFDAVIGVRDLRRSPATLFEADTHMRLTPLAAAPKDLQRQQLAPLYTPNGAIYLIRSETLKTQKTFFPQRSRGLAMDSISSMDLDDAVDLSMMEAVCWADLSWRTAQK